MFDDESYYIFFDEKAISVHKRRNCRKESGRAIELATSQIPLILTSFVILHYSSSQKRMREKKAEMKVSAGEIWDQEELYQGSVSMTIWIRFKFQIVYLPACAPAILASRADCRIAWLTIFAWLFKTASSLCDWSALGFDQRPRSAPKDEFPCNVYCCNAITCPYGEPSQLPRL